MRLFLYWLLLAAGAAGGCAAQYQAPDGKPVAELRFQSDTMPKSGVNKGIIAMELYELAPEGAQPLPRLGYVTVGGDELDRVLKIEAGRSFQFKPVILHHGFHCQAPFKTKLLPGNEYVLKMNIDSRLRECEIELLNISVSPARRMGGSRESSAYMSTSSNGMTTTSHTINPVRPPSNPTFE